MRSHSYEGLNAKFHFQYVKWDVLKKLALIHQRNFYVIIYERKAIIKTSREDIRRKKNSTTYYSRIYNLGVKAILSCNVNWMINELDREFQLKACSKLYANQIRKHWYFYVVINTLVGCENDLKLCSSCRMRKLPKVKLRLQIIHEPWPYKS